MALVQGLISFSSSIIIVAVTLLGVGVLTFLLLLLLIFFFPLLFRRGEGWVAIIINIDGREGNFMQKVVEFRSVTSMATLMIMSLAVEEDELNVVTPQVQGF